MSISTDIFQYTCTLRFIDERWKQSWWTDISVSDQRADICVSDQRALITYYQVLDTNIKDLGQYVYGWGKNIY